MFARIVQTVMTSIILLVATTCSAQTVSTINFSSSTRADGIDLTNDGNLIMAGSYSGSNLVEVELPGGQLTVRATGLSGPIEAAPDPEGNYFVTNWHQGRISQVTADGTVSTFATVPSRGDGVAFDAEGNLWHTNGSDDRVSIIDSNGSVNVISSQAGLGYPLGIALADDDRMYIAGATSGKIWRMDPSGSASLIATVPSSGTWAIGHIAAGSGCLYASGLSSNRIYKITLDGEVSVLAGTGVSGAEDGPADQATFNFPNGIILSQDGQRLYVTKGSGYVSRVRVIELSTVAPVPELRSEAELHSISPNPFNPATTVEYELHQASAVQFSVFDVAGRLVWNTDSNAVLPAGHHSIVWRGLNNSGQNLPSGSYLLRMSARNFQATKRMTLVR